MTYFDFAKPFENTHFSKEQKAFIIAKSWHEFLQEQEKEVTKKVIAENEFFYPESWEKAGIKKGDRITDPNDSCMLSKDPAQWTKFYNLFYAECQKRGIATDYNKVITYESRKLYYNAGDILIDWFLEQVNNYQDKNTLLKTFNFDSSKSEEIKNSFFTRKSVINLAMKWKA